MTPPHFTTGEEIANGITRGIGAVLTIAGLATLTAFSARAGTALHVVACSIFGAAMIDLYLTSTLYHAVSNQRIKQTLRALDHSAIFVLIAATYTPFMLVSLHGPLGWSFLAAMWLLAVLGIALRLGLRGRWHGLVVATYLAMGWAAILLAEPLLEHLATGGLVLLAAGGLAHTFGVPFYKWRKLPYNHAIWHLFVLLGSTLHLLRCCSMSFRSSASLYSYPTRLFRRWVSECHAPMPSECCRRVRDGPLPWPRRIYHVLEAAAGLLSIEMVAGEATGAALRPRRQYNPQVLTR